MQSEKIRRVDKEPCDASTNTPCLACLDSLPWTICRLTTKFQKATIASRDHRG